MPHQVFVGIAQNIVAIRSVLGEVERRVFKDRDQVAQPIDHLFVATKLCSVIEVRHIGQLVGTGERSDDFLVDLIANILRTLQRDHILEA